jgi:N utilization substance protein B
VSDKQIGGIGSRREARERAVELAYEAEVRGMSASEIVESQLTEVDEFVVQMLTIAEENRAKADALIEERSEGWSLSRIATMDKVVMRLAIGELLGTDIPVGVALNEAISLVGRYSTAESGRFVNGVLNAIAEQVRPQASGSSN